MPNAIAIRTESFKWFREEGLKDAFLDVFPINDKNGKLTLDFVDYKFDESEIKYPVEECKERDVTYSVPLKVNVRRRIMKPVRSTSMKYLWVICHG